MLKNNFETVLDQARELAASLKQKSVTPAIACYCALKNLKIEDVEKYNELNNDYDGRFEQLVKNDIARGDADFDMPEEATEILGSNKLAYFFDAYLPCHHNLATYYDIAWAYSEFSKPRPVGLKFDKFPMIKRVDGMVSHSSPVVVDDAYGKVLECLPRVTTHSPLFIIDDPVKAKDILIGIGRRLISESQDHVAKKIEYVYYMDAAKCKSMSYKFTEAVMKLTSLLQKFNGVLLIHGYDNILNYFDDGPKDVIEELRLKNRVICTTTEEDFMEDYNKDNSMGFHLINLIKVDKTEDDIRILDSAITHMCGEHLVTVKFSAEELYSTIKRSLGEKVYEDACNILDMAMSLARRKGKRAVELETVKSVLPKEVTASGAWSLIEAQERSNNLLQSLKDRIKGQDAACEEIVEAITAWSLTEKKRPISFIASGQPGVGKTEMAKQLATILPGYKLCRFNMTNYSATAADSGLFGASAGYVGYSEDGGDLGKALVEAKEEGKSVILFFDEVEKCTKKVLNQLLQTIDEGMIITPGGETLEFKDAIVYMTTNASVTEQESPRVKVGFIHGGELCTGNKKSMRAALLECEAFSPEFLDRIDHILSFNPLTEKDLYEIARTYLQDSAAEFFKNHGVEIRYDKSIPAYIAMLATNGHGARGVHRYCNQAISTANKFAVQYPSISQKKGIVVKMVDDAITAQALTVTKRAKSTSKTENSAARTKAGVAAK